MTAAGARPASRARSTEPSVWPARTSTPPARARSGKTWPGRARSSGRASSRTAVSTVWARSRALMPVVTPVAASTLTVKAVPYFEVLAPSSTMSGSRSLRTFSSVRARQIRPRPCLAMKLMASGVTFSAATHRSPSFSRSSSSMRTTVRPCRMASTAASIRSTACSAWSIMTPRLRTPSRRARPPGLRRRAGRPAAQLHQPGHVAGHHVGLQVHLPAGGRAAQRRALQASRG